MLSLMLTGCTTGPRAMTSSDRVGTIVAATYAAAPHPTSTRPPVATSMPPEVGATQPAQSPAPPQRIEFLPDASTAIVREVAAPGQIRAFVFRADLGQALIVQVDSTAGDVHLGLKTEGGTSLLLLAAGQAGWSGAAPATEDYLIQVKGGSAMDSFTLTVEKPRKIKFKEGAVSARILDRVMGGLPLAYSVLAVKGDELEVGLSGTGSKAALGVSGYVDGKVYLDPQDGETSFSMEVPSTQDYIVEIVPEGGQALDFALAVQAQ